MCLTGVSDIALTAVSSCCREGVEPIKRKKQELVITAQVGILCFPKTVHRHSVFFLSSSETGLFGICSYPVSLLLWFGTIRAATSIWSSTQMNGPANGGSCPANQASLCQHNQALSLWASRHRATYVSKACRRSLHATIKHWAVFPSHTEL